MAVTTTIGTGTGSAGTGTISVTSGTTTVTGSGTDFIGEIDTGAGGILTIFFGGNLYTVASVASDTSLTLAENSATTESGSSFTLGLRHYSTITLWEADLDNSTLYASDKDAIGECYADSDFDEGSAVVMNGGGTVSLTSAHLTAPSGESHTGVENTGVRLTQGGTDNYGKFSLAPPASINDGLEISFLEIDNNGGGGSSFATNAASFGRVPTIRNCILHDATLPSGDHTQGFIFATTRDARVMNNIAYNLRRDSTAAVYGLGNLDSDRAEGGCLNNTAWKFENQNTGAMYGLNVATNDATDGNVQNNIIVTSDDGDFNWNAGSSYGGACDNNLSKDTTAGTPTGATNEVISVTVTDLFVSTVGTIDLSPQDTAAPQYEAGKNLGTTPTNVNIDAKRVTRSGTWEIGATEFEAAGETTTITASNFTYAGGTVGSSLTANRATTLTGSNFTYAGAAVGSALTENRSTSIALSNFTYAGASITSTVGGNVSTAITASDLTYAAGTVGSTLTENRSTTLTASNFTYASATVGSTIGANKSTTIAGANYTYTGATINSVFPINYTTVIAGSNYTFTGGAITSFAGVAQATTITPSNFTYTGATITSTLQVDITTAITASDVAYIGASIDSGIAGQTFTIAPILADLQTDIADIMSETSILSDFADILDTNEIAATVSVNTSEVAAITHSNYLGSRYSAYEVSSQESYFYALQSDLDAASAVIGSNAYMYSQAYTIASMEIDRETNLTRVTLRNA